MIINQNLSYENETHRILWGFEIQTNQLISARSHNICDNSKKRKAYRIVDFPILVEGKSKKTKRETNTWTLPENQEGREILEMTVIPIVIDELGMVSGS